MENRDVAALLELTLNFKAARGGNIFQIDAAKAAREKGNGVDDLINILAPNAQRNGVHIAERFKEDAFALHHRHAGLRADIAQAQHRRAVCDDGYRIPAACEVIGFIYILLDLQAGLRNTCLLYTSISSKKSSVLHPKIILLASILKLQNKKSINPV